MADDTSSRFLCKSISRPGHKAQVKDSQRLLHFAVLAMWQVEITHGVLRHIAEIPQAGRVKKADSCSQDAVLLSSVLSHGPLCAHGQPGAPRTKPAVA